MNDEQVDRRLGHILRIHFDPDMGSPYWLEKAGELGISPLAEIRSTKDLAIFGPMDEDALATRPIEDFVPKRCWREKSKWIIGETGGTTGNPKTTVYHEEEFYHAFIHPFVIAAKYRKFPLGANWLWIGPTGPHIIGKAAGACAKALGSPDPFTVDFDPRWVKKFAPDSIAFQRYLEHVIDQAMRIIATQHITVLFSTPKVFIRLQEVMSSKQREAIRGIHFGGMELNQERFQAIHEAFPKALFISGYGNTLFGMCPEFLGDPALPLDYYPVGARLVFQTVPLNQELTPEEKLKQPCSIGETGQIVFSRLDESFLILNHFERDQGELIVPTNRHRDLYCAGLGIRNPAPLTVQGTKPSVAVGLY